MLSAEDAATIKVAIEVCNNPELKKEILFTRGIKKEKYNRKAEWSDIIEEKGTHILENVGLTKPLLDKVLGVVILVGVRMLTWAEYHEGTLGLLREYSIKFLNSSFFTSQGIIDSKKAAEELMKDKILNTKQQYKLACLYCFTEHIPVLYRRMSKEDREQFYNSQRPQDIKQPGLVKFWTYYLMGDIDKIKGEKSLNQYRLEKAVESGSKAAVEYCLQKTSLSRRKYSIEVAAIETVKNRIIRGPSVRGNIWNGIENDKVVFSDWGYNCGKKSWIPSSYYIDILCSLLSKMSDDQKIHFLMKDIAGLNYEEDPLSKFRYSRVLGYLLNWPYQNYFIKTAKLMWEFLPKQSYADLLLDICDKIESYRGARNYGEEKSYNYRKLLMEFWCWSPVRYKKYVFNVNEKNGDKKASRGVKELFNKLFSLKNFTSIDMEHIKLILACATDEEKENLILSQEGKDICIKLLKKKSWEIFEEFVSNCFSSKEQTDMFKSEFISTKKVQSICITFIRFDEWDSAETFIKMSALRDEEIIGLKKEIISSEDGKRACVDLAHFKEAEAADRFIRWGFHSEEEVKTFKRELVLSSSGMSKFDYLVSSNELQLADKIINFGLCIEEEIREFKKNLAYREGCSLCEKLISDHEILRYYDKYINTYIKVEFNGGKWEEVEKFFTWCFSSEEEISEFKKGTLLKTSGKKIHFELNAANKWDEAETFFAWLGLSSEEVRELKKETLLSSEALEDMNELLHDYAHVKFESYGGGNWEKIELTLRWCLIDEEALLEFKSRFDEEYGFKSYDDEEETVSEEKAIILKKFYALIEELLNDFSQKSKTKRKLEVSEEESTNKKIHNLEL